MSNSSSYRHGSQRIALSVEERDYESIKLALQAFEASFCMRGEAFFSAKELEGFVSSLREFPINECTPPSLSGGYFDESGNIVLPAHVHISVSRFLNTGMLAMTVSVFCPHPIYWKDGFGAGGRITYFLQYEGLMKFCNELERLISSDSSFFEFGEFECI